MHATSLRFLACLALLLGVLVGAPASQAATVTIVVADMAFTPKVKMAAQGTAVTWDFRESGHTTVSRQEFWHSPTLASGHTYRVVFSNAGRFGYVCVPHESLGMVGAIVVPMRRSGASGDGWTLRWSSLSLTPSSRSFDVQVRKLNSTTWQSFRTNTTTRSAFFNPTKSGTYAFRARTDNLTSGQSSRWSPAMSVSIT